MADHSLDSYIHDNEIVQNLTGEEKERFKEWIAKLSTDPSRISAKVEDALRNALFSEWEAESKNHQFKLGSYYPSIIERCVRQQAYSYTEPHVPSPEDLAIFSEGKAIHELIASTLRQSGLVSVEGKEIVVDLEFPEAKLHGRIDDLLLVRLSDNNEDFALYVPLEIKSTSNIPEEPKQTHYYQLSTYLLAENFPFGVLLYWAKREGKIKAFTVEKNDGMHAILQKRVEEIHESLKAGELPHKEAAINHDYQQCERCTYNQKCNPFLIESIPKGSGVVLFDIDSSLFDTSPRRKAVLETIGLPISTRIFDIHDEETKNKYWELYNNEKFLILDVVNELGKKLAYEQNELGRILIGISANRNYDLFDITKAMLANFGLPIHHLILREKGNYETDTRFKTKWALRLNQNYEVLEYFDRDAITNSLIMKAIEQQKSKSST